jgi:hypothetical protein
MSLPDAAVPFCFSIIQLQDMSLLRLLILCLFVSSLFAQNAAKSGRPDQIVVITAQPGWSIGKKTLQRGDPLPAFADLIGTAEAGDLVLKCGQAGWYAYNCGGKSCRVPVCAAQVAGVKVTRSDPGVPVWREKADLMLLALMGHEPKDAPTLGVRGGGNPSEAVLVQTIQGVHWGPALNRVLEGRYCFRLSSLPAGPSKTFTLDWDRSVASEGIASVPGLTPGLYSLDKGSRPDGSCDFDPDATPAWVIVASERDFKRVGEQWKESAAWFQQIEQSGAGPAVVVTAHHAALAFLADSLSKK